MRSHLALVLLALPACGGGGNTPVDAAIDAPDVLIDAPPPPPDTFRYVVSKQVMPSSNQQARDFGLDLDGDQVVDNQLGLVLSTLAAQGLATQGATDTAVAKGEVLMLGEILANSITADPSATFTLYTGTNPMPAPCADANDTVCGHHLAGTATFDVHPTSARDTPLAGAIAGGVFTAGPGHLRVQFLMGEGGVLEANLIGARVRLQMLADTSIGDVSVIAGAMEQAEVNAVIVPGITRNANRSVMADCNQLAQPPLCGCTPSSTGRTMLDLFDMAPKDCAITNEEVATNSLIQSLLAPDLTVEGKQALSVGFSVKAVHAAFTP